MMCNNSEYESIFNRVSAIRCSDEKLTYFKNVYAKVINSKRQLQRIKDLAELLQVLQKRDHINPHNIDTLTDIAATLGDFLIKPLSSQYTLNNSNNNNTTTNTNRNGCQGIDNSHTQNRQHNVIPPLSGRPKDRIYEVIASDIGQKWADLARHLHVPEGHIDTLHAARFTDRVYQVLRFHEDRCDPRVQWSSLLDALTDARRNDLRKKVQNIFDTYTER